MIFSSSFGGRGILNKNYILVPLAMHKVYTYNNRTPWNISKQSEENIGSHNEHIIEVDRGTLILLQTAYRVLQDF